MPLAPALSSKITLHFRTGFFLVTSFGLRSHRATCVGIFPLHRAPPFRPTLCRLILGNPLAMRYYQLITEEHARTDVAGEMTAYYEVANDNRIVHLSYIPTA